MADKEGKNDFDPKDFTRTVNQHDTDLVSLKEQVDELTGKKLDEKICKAIEDSTHIQEKVGSIVWKVVREKLVWILLTLIALLLWDSLKTLIQLGISKIG